MEKHVCSENGQILNLETLIEELELVNFYNANTESEQIQTFNELSMLLSNLDLSSEKHNILAGHFNIFPGCSLDAKGGSTSLKNAL